MSYRITEADGQHISTIEEIKVFFERKPGGPGEVPKTIVHIKDGDLLDISGELPRYKFQVDSSDDKLSKLHLVDELTGYDIVCDGHDSKGLGWRYKISGIFEDIAAQQYLTGFKLIRINDGLERDLSLTSLGDTTLKSIFVDNNATIQGEFLVKENVLIEKNLTVNGVSSFKGEAVFDTNIKTATIEVSDTATLKTGIIETANVETLNVSDTSSFSGPLFAKSGTFAEKVLAQKGIEVTEGIKADTAEIQNLTAKVLNTDEIHAQQNIIDNLTSTEATITNLKTDNVTSKKITSEFVSAEIGNISGLRVTSGANISGLNVTDGATLEKANIKVLTSEKGDVSGTLTVSGMLDVSGVLKTTGSLQADNVQITTETVDTSTIETATIKTLTATNLEVDTLTNKNFSTKTSSIENLTVTNLATIKEEKVEKSEIENLSVSNEIATNKIVDQEGKVVYNSNNDFNEFGSPDKEMILISAPNDALDASDPDYTRIRVRVNGTETTLATKEDLVQLNPSGIVDKVSNQTINGEKRFLRPIIANSVYGEDLEIKDVGGQLVSGYVPRHIITREPDSNVPSEVPNEPPHNGSDISFTKIKAQAELYDALLPIYQDIRKKHKDVVTALGKKNAINDLIINLTTQESNKKALLLDVTNAIIALEESINKPGGLQELYDKAKSIYDTLKADYDATAQTLEDEKNNLNNLNQTLDNLKNITKDKKDILDGIKNQLSEKESEKATELLNLQAIQKEISKLLQQIVDAENQVNSEQDTLNKLKIQYAQKVQIHNTTYPTSIISDPPDFNIIPTFGSDEEKNSWEAIKNLYTVEIPQKEQDLESAKQEVVRLTELKNQKIQEKTLIENKINELDTQIEALKIQKNAAEQEYNEAFQNQQNVQTQVTQLELNIGVIQAQLAVKASKLADAKNKMDKAKESLDSSLESLATLKTQETTLTTEIEELKIKRETAEHDKANAQTTLEEKFTIFYNAYNGEYKTKYAEYYVSEDNYHNELFEAWKDIVDNVELFNITYKGYGTILNEPYKYYEFIVGAIPENIIDPKAKKVLLVGNDTDELKIRSAAFKNNDKHIQSTIGGENKVIANADDLILKEFAKDTNNKIVGDIKPIFGTNEVILSMTKNHVVSGYSGMAITTEPEPKSETSDLVKLISSKNHIQFNKVDDNTIDFSVKGFEGIEGGVIKDIIWEAKNPEELICKIENENASKSKEYSFKSESKDIGATISSVGDKITISNKLLNIYTCPDEGRPPIDFNGTFHQDPINGDIARSFLDKYNALPVTQDTYDERYLASALDLKVLIENQAAIRKEAIQKIERRLPEASVAETGRFGLIADVRKGPGGQNSVSYAWDSSILPDAVDENGHALQYDTTPTAENEYALKLIVLPTIKKLPNGDDMEDEFGNKVYETILKWSKIQ